MISLEINDKFKTLKRAGIINGFSQFENPSGVEFLEIEFANASKERLERIVEFLNEELDRKVKTFVKNPENYKIITEFI